jgi:hypothetical protein
MTDYSNISKSIGEKNWQDCITHDNGQFAQNGGGKSTLYLSQPGQGKSTLMCYAAQMSRSLHGSKLDFVKDLMHREPLDRYAGKVFQETVIWRARDMDSFANIIPQNWITSMKGSMGSTKDLHLWVHERDKDIIFYSYNHKRQEITVQNLPPPIYYRDAEDILRRLKWGAINVVLEPQTYSLSPTLIQRLREKKMDISDEEERDQEWQKDQRKKTGHRKKTHRATQTSYEKREVSPSYFWFDLIHVAKRMNKYRHIMISIDEIDDVFEARSEGDVWKLIEMLANDWKDLRKSNISTNLSTHETDFIDWRILKRIDYFVWMAGASVHSAYSMLKLQNLVSDLPIGSFLIERRKMDFGFNTFGKIPLAQPAVRIDGLKGEDFNLSPSVSERLMRAYEDAWGIRQTGEIINLDEIEEQPKKEVEA